MKDIQIDKKENINRLISTGSIEEIKKFFTFTCSQSLSFKWIVDRLETAEKTLAIEARARELRATIGYICPKGREPESCKDLCRLCVEDWSIIEATKELVEKNEQN